MSWEVQVAFWKHKMSGEDYQQGKWNKRLGLASLEKPINLKSSVWALISLQFGEKLKETPGWSVLVRYWTTMCSQNSSNLPWQSFWKSGTLLEEGKTILTKDTPFFYDSGECYLVAYTKMSPRCVVGTFFLQFILVFLFSSPSDIFSQYTSLTWAFSYCLMWIMAPAGLQWGLTWGLDGVNGCMYEKIDSRWFYKSVRLCTGEVLAGTTEWIRIFVCLWICVVNSIDSFSYSRLSTAWTPLLLSFLSYIFFPFQLRISGFPQSQSFSHCCTAPEEVI